MRMIQRAARAPAASVSAHCATLIAAVVPCDKHGLVDSTGCIQSAVQAKLFAAGSSTPEHTAVCERGHTVRTSHTSHKPHAAAHVPPRSSPMPGSPHRLRMSPDEHMHVCWPVSLGASGTDSLAVRTRLTTAVRTSRRSPVLSFTPLFTPCIHTCLERPIG